MILSCIHIYNVFTCHVSHVVSVVAFRASSFRLLLLINVCTFMRILTLLLFYHDKICINVREVDRIFKLSASGNILVFVTSLSLFWCKISVVVVTYVRRWTNYKMKWCIIMIWLLKIIDKQIYGLEFAWAMSNLSSYFYTIPYSEKNYFKNNIYQIEDWLVNNVSIFLCLKQHKLTYFIH